MVEILEITKEIYAEVKKYNESLKNSEPCLNPATGEHMLSGFSWPAWSILDPKIQQIHILRTQLLYYNGAALIPAPIQHKFFIEMRKKAGWRLGEKRIDYIEKNGIREWVGSDPFLMPFEQVNPIYQDAFQGWCVARNKINSKIMRKYV